VVLCWRPRRSMQLSVVWKTVIHGKSTKVVVLIFVVAGLHFFESRLHTKRAAEEFIVGGLSVSCYCRV
jgi:hypothetical protein